MHLNAPSTLSRAALLSIALVVLGCATSACSDDASQGDPAPATNAGGTTAPNAGTTGATTNNPHAGNNTPIGQHTAEYCGQCHTSHYDDWEGSMHAYATVDPIFQAMLAKGIEETEGKLDQFCIQCHAPVASKYGLTPVFEDGDDGLHKVDLNMAEPLIGQGVQCVTCHSISQVNATLNADFVFDTTTYYGPTGSAAAQAAHPMSGDGPLTDATMCGSCHNVVNPKGALLENTFSEWYSGPYNDGSELGGISDQDCRGCHMPAYEGEIVDGTTTTIHRHRFIGVDLALVDDFPDKEEQLRLVTELLRSCARLELERTEDHDGAIALRASVTNINNGHALPSGSTADRQVWVHLTVTDEAGEVVYESGMLDANGDLMDRVEGHSLDPEGDPELLLYGSLLFGDDGQHVTFPWQAARSQDILLQPGQTGWREYLIPRSGLDGQTLTATAVLRYRTFPPFLVRQLQHEGYLDRDFPEIPIVDMAETSLTVRIP